MRGGREAWSWNCSSEERFEDPRRSRWAPVRAGRCSYLRTMCRLQRLFVAITRADSHDGFDRVDEQLSVANFARARRFDDPVERPLLFLGLHADLKHHLGA